jgi:uncharacterized RDD family membrane protein YckC
MSDLSTPAHSPVAPPPPSAYPAQEVVLAPPVLQVGIVASAPVLPAGVRAASPWARLGSYLLESILVVVTLGIGWLIWAATIAGSGQTPAKKLLGLRVINADSMRPASFAKMSWVRGLVAGLVAGIAIPLTIGVLLFMPFWDTRRQNLWDKVSNTFVVNDSSDAWNTRPDIR